ncbi:MAG TPA: transporter substrate-binding domain-containing protein [Noviherbaspirillum sp.]|uniref:transporter substrate-binding domain-containing protein n=1 Tax=Noviherbaspirillum sp. TaxID=1926288 RepID=UPI002B499A46|nr:transporter substrate-binding domain-containing protein [Noviherbaspirillum sp.]HJV87537.1 transporter substrate-binding domain-containing protein [Noviherbaspirillum sp.]
MSDPHLRRHGTIASSGTRKGLKKAALGIVLVAVCAGILAAPALDHAKRRKKLIAGVSYVVPAYKAGTKFRTPEVIDTALAEDIAHRLNLPLTTVRVETKADIALMMLTERARLPRSATIIPTGYAAGPMAIMRSDTTIKSWDDLKGRKVCLSESGHYVGMPAAKYGAVEMVFKAPADALIALRTGACDAAVHDNTILEELIKLPEWKKFSATLNSTQRAPLALIVPKVDTNTTTFLTQVVQDWMASGYLDQLTKKAVQNIAFEVYLDQDVPDCH